MSQFIRMHNWNNSNNDPANWTNDYTWVCLRHKYNTVVIHSFLMIRTLESFRLHLCDPKIVVLTAVNLCMYNIVNYQLPFVIFTIKQNFFCFFPFYGNFIKDTWVRDQSTSNDNKNGPNTTKTEIAFLMIVCK